MVISIVFLIYSLLINSLVMANVSLMGNNKDLSGIANIANAIFLIICACFFVFYLKNRQIKTPSGIVSISGLLLSLFLIFTGALDISKASNGDIGSLGSIFILCTTTSVVSSYSWRAVAKKSRENAPSKLTVKNRERSLLGQTISGAISYISAVIISFLYMLYLDEESGMIIFSIMLIVPLISLLLALFARAGVRVEISSSSDQISKGEDVILTITVTKKTMLPAPFIDLVLYVPAGFNETEFDTCRIAMSINKSTSIRIPLKGKICGRSMIGLHRVTISDYLSIFRFNIKDTDLIICPVDVIPEVSAEIDCNDIFTALTTSVSFNDEEDGGVSAYTTNASPGYDHREYVPGDPLKRVNWKLSSKRNALMVRLDEAPSIIRPTLVFDYVADIFDNEADSLMEFERGCEALLAFASFCVMWLVECTVYFSDGRQLTDYVIDSNDAVKRLALLFGAINVPATASSKRCIYYDEVLDACKSSKNAVIFSNAPRSDINLTISELEGFGVSVITVDSKPSDNPQDFFIDNDGNIRRN